MGLLFFITKNNSIFNTYNKKATNGEERLIRCNPETRNRCDKGIAGRSYCRFNTG